MAIRLNPYHSDSQSNLLASVYRKSGQYTKATACLKEILSLNPDGVWVYQELASNYLEQWTTQQNENPKVLDKALAMAKKGFAIEESFLGIPSLFIHIYLKRRQYEEALSEAERLIARYPELGDSYGILALVFLYLGRSEESVEMIEKAMQLNPSSPTWYFTVLAHAYANSGRQTEAMGTYKGVLDNNPAYLDAFHAHIWLAILYVELGQEENARAEAEKVLKLVPNFSVEVWGERVPFKDQALIERHMAALRKAGLK